MRNSIFSFSNMEIFDWFVLVSLGCLAAMGIGRAMQLARRGTRVFAIDPDRSMREALADLVFVLTYLLWIFELFVTSCSFGDPIVPDALETVLIDSRSIRILGALVMLAGLVIYALALRAFGSSWRLGIDRAHPGTLVTRGIFSRTRNPIYVALLLLALGAFLIQGSVILLLLTIVFAAYFRTLILREEEFLVSHYGDPYVDYLAKVGRYWTWRS